jgi:hypothetical protein
LTIEESIPTLFGVNASSELLVNSGLLVSPGKKKKVTNVTKQMML